MAVFTKAIVIVSTLHDEIHTSGFKQVLSRQGITVDGYTNQVLPL